MIPQVKCSSGAIISAGQIVKIPFGAGLNERIVYATFEGMQGCSRVRSIGLAISKSPRGTKAICVQNILDGEKVQLGRSMIFYPKSVPLRPVNKQEEQTYKAKIVEAIKAKTESK